MDKTSYNMQSYLSQPAAIRPMGRIDAIKTAQILGFEQHDIPVFIQKGLLRPLASPMPNARKYFAAAEIFRLAENAKWLADARDVLYKHWQEKNSRREKETANAQ